MKLRINYVEVGFRINDITEGIKGDAGLKWKEGDNEYYASISNNFQIYETSKDSHGNRDKKLIYQNTEIQKNEGIWYNLKVKSLADSLRVYVNDVQNIKVPKVLSSGSIKQEDNPISKVGLSCSSNSAEFSPPKIGTISDPLHRTSSHEMGSHYDKYDYYYYPLSILALSKIKYDIFMDTDLSSLTKKVVILAFDPSKTDWNDDMFRRYIEYVKGGGTIVVITPEENHDGRFSQFISATLNDTDTEFIEFRNITGQDNGFNTLNVSDEVKKAHTASSTNQSIIRIILVTQQMITGPEIIQFKQSPLLRLKNNSLARDDLFG